jgi:hypothetical protein
MFANEMFTYFISYFNLMESTIFRKWKTKLNLLRKTVQPDTPENCKFLASNYLYAALPNMPFLSDL